MLAQETRRTSATSTPQKIRLELVDNAHAQWPAVSDWIQRSGDSAQLWDQDGYLSARQIIVAAFAAEKVVGHLGFRVDPKRSRGKIILEARIDSLHVQTPDLESLLFTRAQAHARLLGCRALRPQ